MSGAIGVFDSGVGGLTVMREIARVLPYQDILYFGDIAHTPYGSKSPYMIKEFAKRIVEFLQRQGVKLIVVACNTVSSVALDELKKEFSIPLLGVIEPGVKKALNVTKNFRIGVIGTEATIRSGAYQRALKMLKKDAKIYAKACPLFVPLVEEGWCNGMITREIARRYLSPLLRKKIDTLILGCTHYPLLKDTLRKVVGEDVELVDASIPVAEEVKEIVKREKILKNEGKPSYKFFVTDAPEKFLLLGKRILKDAFSNVIRVNADV